MYGFLAEGEAIELVTYRLEATGRVRKAALPRRVARGADASAAIIGRREVWMPEAGGMVSCPVYDRERLEAGNCIAGPAIIEQMDATTVILPGMQAEVEPSMNLIVEIRA
jgi:N-methylhydantoinase A